MKSLITYILALLLFVGCSKDLSVDDSFTFADGEGCVLLSLAMPSTRSGSAELLDDSELKIYSVDSDSGEQSLVRRYIPATEIPEALYLVAGSYKAMLSVGNDAILITTDSNDLCYSGECDIEVLEGQSIDATLTATMRNSIFEVAFDESIAENFADGYALSVVASSESGFTDEIYEAADVKMTFAESGSIYLMLDVEDAPTSLLWQFKGVKLIEGVAISDTAQSFYGKISAPAAQEKSTLSFKYSDYLQFDLTNEFLTVDYSTDDYDDTLHFSPQPTITSADSSFVVTETQAASKSYLFNVQGLNPLSTATVTVNKVAVSDGVSFVIDSSDDMKATLTLTPETFASIAEGDSATVCILVVDDDEGEGELEFTVARTGISSLSNVDYWLNTATVSAIVSEGDATDVSFAYCESGSSEWFSCDGAVASDKFNYTAAITPSWSTAYSNGSYSLLSGVMAGKSYDVRMVVDGVEYTKTFSAGGTQQTISTPTSNNSCVGTSNSSTTDWGSGNNTFTSSLCKYDDDTSSLKLTATATAGNFAAGNLFYGQFDFDLWNTEGTVKFGQAYTWTSRPKSFKVTYKATVGTCDYIENSGQHPLTSSSVDPARIYFAIVDWSGRHEVTSGSGQSPSGTWDPETMSSVDKGNIIGYASMFITESVGSFTDAELEIFYYDKTTKPSSSIGIVVSCVTSAYGDYMSGSTSNRLYVKDFGFGY